MRGYDKEFMRIEVRLKPNARIEAVELIGEGKYAAAVNKPAVEGKANKALIDLLSGYFDVPKSSIEIIKGHKSKNKIVEISEKA